MKRLNVNNYEQYLWIQWNSGITKTLDLFIKYHYRKGYHYSRKREKRRIYCDEWQISGFQKSLLWVRCIDLSLAYQAHIAGPHTVCDTRALVTHCVILILGLDCALTGGTCVENRHKSQHCSFLLYRRKDKMLKIFFLWKILVLSFLRILRSNYRYYRGGGSGIDTCYCRY